MPVRKHWHLKYSGVVRINYCASVKRASLNRTAAIIYLPSPVLPQGTNGSSITLSVMISSVSKYVTAIMGDS